MPTDNRCAGCGQNYEYWAVHCRCGQLLGFPNRRIALEQLEQLDSRHADAATDAEMRGVAGALRKLETLAARSQIAISMSVEVADDLMRDAKYRNYHDLVDQAVRNPAEKGNESTRTMVGARLFPSFFQHIYYAVLSPDGRGPTSYGGVALRWQVTDSYLGPRISVHEENSYNFYDRHGLGDRAAVAPEGYIGIWNDRHKVAGAKLARQITPATSDSDMPAMLMKTATSREDDDFIEVAIYSDKGIDTIDVDCVTIQKRTGDARRLELLKESCAKRSPPVEFRS